MKYTFTLSRPWYSVLVVAHDGTLNPVPFDVNTPPGAFNTHACGDCVRARRLRGSGVRKIRASRTERPHYGVTRFSTRIPEAATFVCAFCRAEETEIPS